MPKHRLESPEWIANAPIVFSNSIEIEAPPAAAWERIADHERWPEWFDALDSVEVTGSPTGVGGKRRVTSKRMPLDEEFTAWTEGEQFAFAVVKSPLVFVDVLAEDVQIEPTNTGCRVTYRQGIAGKRGFDWLAKLALGSLDAGTAESLRKLKALVEA